MDINRNFLIFCMGGNFLTGFKYLINVIFKEKADKQWKQKLIQIILN